MIPEASAAVNGEDVGDFVGLFGQRGNVALDDALLLVLVADEVVHVEPHPELGRTEHGAVRVEIVVGGRRGREPQGAAAGDVGCSDLLLRLILIGGLRLRLLLLVGLLSGCLRLGLLLLLRLGLLLRRRSLLLLLRSFGLDPGRGLGLIVVVIVAAADQREPSRADPGTSRGAQERAPAHSVAAHALPVVPFACHGGESSHSMCGSLTAHGHACIMSRSRGSAPIAATD